MQTTIATHPADAVPPPHAAHWPPGVPQQLPLCTQTLWQVLDARAASDPTGQALHFLGRDYTWAQLRDEALQLAAALQQRGVQPGDRVLLFTQNSPQFVIAFHAVQRAGGVVVPVNPMNKADELEHYLRDAQAAVAIAASDIAHELTLAADALGADQPLRHLIVFDLAEGLAPGALARQALPEAWQHWFGACHPLPASAKVRAVRWADAVAAVTAPPHGAARDPADLALLPYTSGTTGDAKGCMHTHQTLSHNAAAAGPWLDMQPGDVTLIAVPMFHITGLVMGMLASIRHGCRMVVLPRWDREQAARAIERFGVTHWPNIPTMVMDLLGDPGLARYRLGSLRYIGGGGTQMPDAVAERLEAVFGLRYVEGYGLTETAAPTHVNPMHAPRRHCLGLPHIGTQARVVDPVTLASLPPGEVGEILVAGPQVFLGYWHRPTDTEQAFVTMGGVRYFRTGDLGRCDADGFYTIADRLKRMINASGFKVWPAEVEALLHRHPAVQEACVVAIRDAYRGESVKAYIVLRRDAVGTVDEQALIDWSRQHMAAYKYPRVVELVEQLPKTASGKVLWRVLQAQQDAASEAARAPAP